jgi:hypothetical protein
MTERIDKSAMMMMMRSGSAEQSTRIVCSEKPFPIRHLLIKMNSFFNVINPEKSLISNTRTLNLEKFNLEFISNLIVCLCVCGGGAGHGVRGVCGAVGLRLLGMLCHKRFEIKLLEILVYDLTCYSLVTIRVNRLLFSDCKGLTSFRL